MERLETTGIGAATAPEAARSATRGAGGGASATVEVIERLDGLVELDEAQRRVAADRWVIPHIERALEPVERVFAANTPTLPAAAASGPQRRARRELAGPGSLATAGLRAVRGPMINVVSADTARRSSSNFSIVGTASPCS